MHAPLSAGRAGAVLVPSPQVHVGHAPVQPVRVAVTVVVVTVVAVVVAVVVVVVVCVCVCVCCVVCVVLCVHVYMCVEREGKKVNMKYFH